MIYGLMGTGKSTLANRLAEILDIEVLSTDRERRAMFGASTSPAGYGTGLYQPGSSQQDLRLTIPPGQFASRLGAVGDFGWRISFP